MFRTRPALIGALLLLAASAAQAADRPVQLTVPRPVRREVAAMPLIAAPIDDAERRINAALRRLDANVRKAAGECRTYAGRPGTWQRTVDAAMRGPAYLSLVVQDESFCDGAHPNSDLMSIVYDLRTGAPVDWSTLLPASLTGTMALQQGSNGTRMVTLASKRLFDLYLAGYGARSAPAEERAECREAIQQAGADAPPPMMAWLDAKAGGLAVQFGLPHVVQACAEAVVIPVAALRQEGAAAGLLAALEAAR